MKTSRDCVEYTWGLSQGLKLSLATRQMRVKIVVKYMKLILISWLIKCNMARCLFVFVLEWLSL